MSMKPHSLIGMGYEGVGDIASFLRRVQAHDVSTIVDVRLNPISRKRGFSKTALSNALADVGVAYVHARELGNPKWNRPGFAGPHDELMAARAIYAKIIDSADADARLDEIAAAANDSIVALLCFETDEFRCHRHVLLDRLTSGRGLPAGIG
ncbi:DUF488 domain-containing protein [Spongiactinospora sp. TRM90649]|uniref:DUF488 domain-containing protein n=1 Tax=Spongiactinospora sp. TRM90649 TaxID=3031114 RepID=UPI0023F7B655|nr:DUF488 domain-containing protein [Spongiactinospora sp. TRM90649]MDF5759021.1 DUF488 domain-containing protein [Spongiactinospora sp. TRM90649]